MLDRVARTDEFMPALLLNPLVILYLAVGLLCATPILCECWRQLRQMELDADLTRAMLERGFSAAEIGRILAVSTHLNRPARPPAARKRFVYKA